MHIRAVIAAAVCVGLLGCASSRRVSSNAASRPLGGQRIYAQRSVTPRTSTPQARRLPTWPGQAYRAPSVRTLATRPSTRPLTAAAVPPPPPPPSLYGTTPARRPAATTARLARADATVRGVVRPASRAPRPTHALTTMRTPVIPRAARAKPLAPIRTRGITSTGGSLFGAGYLAPRKKSGSDCKT